MKGKPAPPELRYPQEMGGQHWDNQDVSHPDMCKGDPQGLKFLNKDGSSQIDTRRSNYPKCSDLFYEPDELQEIVFPQYSPEPMIQAALMVQNCSPAGCLFSPVAIVSSARPQDGLSG